jgi:glycerophosphoryl diester phosphodiesterase
MPARRFARPSLARPSLARPSLARAEPAAIDPREAERAACRPGDRRALWRRSLGEFIGVSRLLALPLLLGALAPAAAFDLQGHRGARGLVPENTMAAFRKALDIGVTTLELDLALTRDGVLVVAHDPYVSADLARDPDGRWLTARGPLIRSLSLQELGRYDIGRVDPASAYGRQWSQQRSADGERYPTFAQVLELARADARPVRLNVETKIFPDRPGDTADPHTFATAVVAAIEAAQMASRTTVQSFDWRTLRVVRNLAPAIATACLTIRTESNDNVADRAGKPSAWTDGLSLADHGGSVPKLVKAAGCRGWSPFWRNVDAAAVAEARALGLVVVPWTVNDPAEMGRLIDLGVDGLITDYPDRLRTVLVDRKQPLR